MAGIKDVWAYRDKEREEGKMPIAASVQHVSAAVCHDRESTTVLAHAVCQWLFSDRGKC